MEPNWRIKFPPVRPSVLPEKRAWLPMPRVVKTAASVPERMPQASAPRVRGDRPAANRVLANFEIRTLPIEWQAVHIGAVLFYDVGSVYTKLSTLTPHHAVGIGLRVLFPQFNRMPFSFDGGMSFDPYFRFVPTVASEQVVPLTAIEDPDA